MRVSQIFTLIMAGGGLAQNLRERGWCKNWLTDCREANITDGNTTVELMFGMHDHKPIGQEQYATEEFASVISCMTENIAKNIFKAIQEDEQDGKNEGIDKVDFFCKDDVGIIHPTKNLDTANTYFYWVGLQALSLSSDQCSEARFNFYKAKTICAPESSESDPPWSWRPTPHSTRQLDSYTQNQRINSNWIVILLGLVAAAAAIGIVIVCVHRARSARVSHEHDVEEQLELPPRIQQVR